MATASPLRMALTSLLIAMLPTTLFDPICAQASSIGYQQMATLAGESPLDQFGASVANAGDVNGDGYDDLLVGAPAADSVGTDAGCVYLFLGGPHWDGVPVARFVPEPYSPKMNNFGLVIGKGGDFNGDGFADIFIGSPHDPEWNAAGRVYVYFGGKVVDEHPDLVIIGPDPQDDLGVALSWVGDINGDGFGDLVVGAPGVRPYSSGKIAGRAYVYFGGSSPDGIPDFTLESPVGKPLTIRDYFGNMVAYAGDLNGDSYADFVVMQGADFSAIPLIFHGWTWVYLGGPHFNGTPASQLDSGYSATWGNYPSQMASAAGDFNLDGIGDLVVRATPDFLQGSYLYFGRSSWGSSATPDLSYASQDKYESFAKVLAGDADVDGDGIDDVVFGASFSQVQGENLGNVYVSLGGPGADLAPDVVIAGHANSDGTTGQFGASVATADIDGDGVAEVFVGAPRAFEAIQNSGLVYVLSLDRPLEARAFLPDGHRTIPLNQAPAQVCIQFEPVRGSFDVVDVDPASVRLSAPGIGSTPYISADSGKRVRVSDTDRNGVPELTACFARPEFSRLFDRITGRQVVSAFLDGLLLSGRKFRAPVAMTIVGRPEHEALTTSVSPNPLNPRGTLFFSLERSDVVSIQMFDVHGRPRRTIANREWMGAGPHSVAIDGVENSGAPLGSGVYFYKIETSTRTTAGRFVVLR